MPMLGKLRSFFHHLGRTVLTFILTAVFLAASGAAVVFGLDVLNQRAAAAPPPAQAEAIPVAVKPLKVVTEYTINRRFIGQVEPRKSVDISFELGGRLTEITVDEGDSVTKGQVIARLDTDLLIADRDRLVAAREALSAQRVFAGQQVARNTQLSQEGFASRQRLDQAIATRDELTARIAETEASLAAIEIRLRKSVLRAPFDARVADRLVDGGETLGIGQSVLQLVDDGATIVRVGLPLDIDPSGLKDLNVTIGNTAYTARLHAVRPDIDPITRTRTVLLALQNGTGLELGRTATVHLRDRILEPGAWIPFDAITEGRGNVWSVLVVDQANVVRNAVVEVLHAEEQRLFVRGSFSGAVRMISGGPQRVTPGQIVRVIEGS